MGVDVACGPRVGLSICNVCRKARIVWVYEYVGPGIFFCHSVSVFLLGSLAGMYHRSQVCVEVGGLLHGLRGPFVETFIFISLPLCFQLLIANPPLHG